MSLSSLTAPAEYGLGVRVYPRPRRAARDKPGEPDEPPPAAPESDSFNTALDAANYASRFRANLAQLQTFPGTSAPPDPSASDDALFEFFGHLSVLLVSVRRGDIDRARAAADALAMELMIDGGEPGAPLLLEDLKHMVTAAQSGDEPAARAAARDVARDMRDALEPPRPPPAPLPDPTTLDATAAAYDTLMAYTEGDAPQAA